MLGDEAPYKTEALIDGFRTQRQVTCSEPAHPVLSTRVDGGVVAPLFDSISTNDQRLGDVDSYGQVAWALLSIYLIFLYIKGEWHSITKICKICKIS